MEAGEPEGEGDARISTGSKTRGYQEQVITTLTYSMLSSTLSVVNKYTLDSFPFPASVLAVQLTSTAAVIYVGRVVRHVNLSLISQEIILGFVPLTMSFFALLASSLLLMANSPFNVFLICKSLTPFFMSLSETLYFGTSWPTLQSFVAMLGMAIGSVLYTRYDVQVSATCLLYAVFFIICSVFEGVIAKQTIQKFTLNQTTRTLLMNALACPIAIIWALCMETKALTEIKLNSTLSLGISCVLGLGMGTATMHMRTIFSATYVSVGVCNKFVSLVLANLVLSGSHSLQSTLSTAFVLLCGSFYNGNSATGSSTGTRSRVTRRNCVVVLLLTSFVVTLPLGATNRVHINATKLSGRWYARNIGGSSVTISNTSTFQKASPTAQQSGVAFTKRRVFLCGYDLSSFVSKVFPEYECVPFNALNASSANVGNILAIGMHIPCPGVEAFPGKVLYLNGESSAGQMVPGSYYLGPVDHPSERYKQFYYVTFAGVAMNVLDELLGKRRRGNGSRFLLYVQNHCVPYREEAFRIFSNIGRVSAGGQCHGDLTDYEQLARDGQSWDQASKMFGEFKFGLVMENQNATGYVTEKILNAFLGGTVPIYSGTTEVFNIFNERAFLFYDPRDPQTTVDKVRYLLSNSTAYQEVANEPIMNREQFDEYFSLDGDGKLKRDIRRFLQIQP